MMPNDLRNSTCLPYEWIPSNGPLSTVISYFLHLIVWGKSVCFWRWHVYGLEAMNLACFTLELWVWVQHLLQAMLQTSIGKLTNIHLLGMGFYLLQFDSAESTNCVLALIPYIFSVHLLYLRYWKRGLHTAQDAAWEKLFPVSVNFLGLFSEYIPLIEDLGGAIGLVTSD